MSEVPEVLRGVLDTDLPQRPPKPDDILDGICPIDGEPFATRPWRWHKRNKCWTRRSQTVASVTCSRPCGAKFAGLNRRGSKYVSPDTSPPSPGTSAPSPPSPGTSPSSPGTDTRPAGWGARSDPMPPIRSVAMVFDLPPLMIGLSTAYEAVAVAIIGEDRDRIEITWRPAS